MLADYKVLADVGIGMGLRQCHNLIEQFHSATTDTKPLTRERGQMRLKGIAYTSGLAVPPPFDEILTPFHVGLWYTLLQAKVFLISLLRFRFS